MRMLKKFLILCALFTLTPSIQAGFQAYFDSGVEIGKYRLARVPKLVQDDIRDINQAPIRYSRENTQSWHWPAATLDEYCLYRDGNEKTQMSLEKLGKEHSGYEDETP